MTRRIIVTGAGGYVGRHVVAAAAAAGVPTLAIARSNADASGDLATSVEWLVADVLADDFDLGGLVRPGDMLLHLAWQDGFSHNAPSHLRNLPLHYRLLDRAADSGVKRIAVLGSMHEVGYWEGAIDASTPTNPSSMYGIAKNALRQAAFIAVAPRTELIWLRAFYILGDDRRNHSIFTRLLAAADHGERAFPFTSGAALYDFIEVGELAEQIVAAVLADGETGIVNCCSGEPAALGHVVEAFIADHGLDIVLDYGAYPDRPYDSPGVWGDAGRIRAILART